MMNLAIMNYAFIDNHNLHRATLETGWVVDFARLYSWLKNKHQVSRAFMFLGYVARNEAMYDQIRLAGFEVVFKPTVSIKQQRALKGNCDVELVLQVMIELQHFQKAVIISGDGDFYSLYLYLAHINKLKRIVIPNGNKYSSLLRPFHYCLTFLNNEGLKEKLKKRH